VTKVKNVEKTIFAEKVFKIGQFTLADTFFTPLLISPERKSNFRISYICAMIGKGYESLWNSPKTHQKAFQ
jgi:hypothetical protein